VKKLIITALAIALSTSTLVAHGSNDAYNPLTVPLATSGNEIPFIEYVVEGGAIQNNTFIAQAPVDSKVAGESRVWKWCTSLSDPVCDPKVTVQNLLAVSVLGACQSATEENCVEGLAVGTSPTNMVEGKFLRQTQGDTQAPVAEYNYPGSSTISLWTIPGTELKFAVTSTYHLWFDKGAFHVTDFYADAIPYREQTGDYKAVKIDTDPNTLPENRYYKNFSRNYWSCVFAEDGNCGVAQDIPENTRMKLKVRLSKDVGGWFQGRLQDPVLDVKPFSASNSLVTVEANVVTVPRLTFLTTKEKFTAEEKAWFSRNGQWPTTTGQGTGPQAGHPEDAFPFIAYYREKVKDTATNVNHFWNVTTTAYGNGSTCLQDKTKLLGIVTTNAMAYDGNAPSFESGALNYHVSGLHYMPDGKTPVQGSYSLVMRSDTARCLYGFTNAPISASVTIAGAENSTVATVATSENNGWLTLQANGFTFSEKTIQVKFSQSAPVVVKAPAAKKITITCVKGKTSKKVTAVKPTCPSGYKKK
jgi:hypothetical protein